MMKFDALFRAWGVSRINARLLRRIVYWHPKKQIIRNDVKWSVLTRAQWAQQAGITIHQYSRSLTVLKKLGAVESCRGRFKGLRAAFVRLSDRAEEDLIAYIDAHNYMSYEQLEQELLKADLAPLHDTTANCK